MGISFIKSSVVYFLIGIGMGMFMSITHKFQYAPAHAHINLLGWASLALMGLIYHFFPSTGENSLAKVHYWLYNIGLPIMMIGLLLIESGKTAFEPVIAIGASILSIGVIFFVVNVLINLKNNAGNN
ncbi:cbb3-type cytochrome c oxidase subunit I [Bacillus sp. V5-8f]|uniref:cbb3-type cytochrome c oxidase subunit I n=1 Tax=Bacillus sp. V5-8f TaxID=2053044 RepID=UPI000C7681CF|nr:cytochrome-c oxidase [Bacillus sp. V5-8f]PLT32107.1 cytochrome-c oxidase [Bacillus sp. V5-8f]